MQEDFSKNYTRKEKRSMEANEFICPETGEIVETEDCESPGFGKGCKFITTCNEYLEHKKGGSN